MSAWCCLNATRGKAVFTHFLPGFLVKQFTFLYICQMSFKNLNSKNVHSKALVILGDGNCDTFQRFVKYGKSQHKV